MKYKVKISFIGGISGSQGQIIEIKNNKIAKDLLNVGYIEKIGAIQNENNISNFEGKNQNIDNGDE